MTEDEYKFLEVFYNRGTIQEQSYINYLNSSLPESIENKKEYIDGLFGKFKEFGFIDLTANSNGVYQITPAGKEKYEELSERKEINRKLEHLSSSRSRIFHFDSRFWITLVIVIIVITVVTSIVLNHWGNLNEIFKNIIK